MFFSISETVTYQTSLSPQSIASCLNDEIEPVQTFRINWGFWNNRKKYEGTADEYSFTIRKISQGKNSTFAQAEGTITREAHRTLVKVRFGMPPFLMIFAVFWLGFVSLFLFDSFSMPIDEKTPMQFRYIPIFMLVFGVLLFFGGYKWESYWLKEDLKRILQADIIKER